MEERRQRDLDDANAQRGLLRAVGERPLAASVISGEELPF
jgi:hypothetical protein